MRRHVAVSKEEATLQFDRTVSRDLVHRRAIAEVFVTDSAPGPPGRTFVGVQIPRGHRMNRGSGRAAAVLVLEALRQASIYVAHTELSVPADMVFVFSRMDLRFADAASLDFQGNQLSSMIDLSAELESLPNGRPRRMVFAARLIVDDQILVEADGDVSLVTKEAWPLLRARAGAELTDADEPPSALPISESSIADVIRSPEDAGGHRFEARVLVDDQHPFYFDHPLDHIPAALQVDALDELCIHVLSRRATSCEMFTLRSLRMDFRGFAELSSPAFASVRIEDPSGTSGGDATTLIAEIRQGKSVVTMATLEYALEQVSVDA
ncbi:putative A-factor biosynthesis repeat family protein [Paenarthrobacter aurescens TC1]|uniref:A-factor biosynthesis repeat family protein n=1 Tax=Paenarthrobacter aurescens (strain TC1) TaxID=290340 RepID=A1RA10_PAEAT|nr:putative A-factor biosynthesis repeat family protein [Paenarthrobacter aurescens TC1]